MKPLIASLELRNKVRSKTYLELVLDFVQQTERYIIFGKVEDRTPASAFLILESLLEMLKNYARLASQSDTLW